MRRPEPELPERGDHSLENFLRLLRALVERAPGHVLIPPGARRLLERSEVESILFAKREAWESFSAWMIQAHERGVTFDEDIDDIDDEELSDADEAILVGEVLDDEGAEDIDDAELGDSGEDLEDEDEELEDEELEDDAAGQDEGSAEEDEGDDHGNRSQHDHDRQQQ